VPARFRDLNADAFRLGVELALACESQGEE
jgi:hypothetical protein